MREILKICRHEFRIQMNSKRVWLGYMVGIVLILSQAAYYVRYGQAMGEPINVLEAFIVSGNCDRTIMLLPVGWLLVMSEAPFVNRISFYALYRTKKKTWNQAMLLYIVLQAILYYAVLAMITILFSMTDGYLANIWSYPFVGMVEGTSDVSLYNVSFPSMDFVGIQSVFSGFMHTFILQVLYAILVGILLYVASQLSNQILGPVAAFVFHFLGYEIMKEGYGVSIDFSLLARSIVAYQVGKEALVSLVQSYLIFIILIVVLAQLSHQLVRYIDFKTIAMEEDG